MKITFKRQPCLNIYKKLIFQIAKGQEEQATVSAGSRSHGDGVVSSNSYHGSPSQHLSGFKSGEGFSDEKLFLSGGVRYIDYFIIASRLSLLNIYRIM